MLFSCSPVFSWKFFVRLFFTRLCPDTLYGIRWNVFRFVQKKKNGLNVLKIRSAHAAQKEHVFTREKKKQIEMEKAHKKIAHFISWSFGGVIEWFERRHKELTTYFLVYFRFALHFPPLCLASFVPLEAHNKKFVWNFFQTDGFGIFPFFSFQSRERTKAWQNCFKSVTCHDRMNWLSASWYFYLTLCVVFFSVQNFFFD